MQSRLLLATTIGLLLRLGWWWHAQPEPVSDFEWLRRLAEGLLDHHQYGYPRLEGGKVPAYPIVLAGLMLVSRSVAWLSFVTALLSTALVPLVGVLAKRLGLSDRVAGTSAFVCAVNPTFIFLAPVLATEHLFAATLVASMIVLLGTGASIGLNRAAAAGAIFGLATLSRVDALFYLPVLMVFAWRHQPLRRLKVGAVLLVTAAVVVTPWYLRNRSAIGPGAGLSTAGGATFYHAHHDGPYGWRPLTGTPLEGVHQLELHQKGYELGFDYLRRAGLRGILRDVAIATGHQFLPFTSPYALRFSIQRAGPSPDEFTEKPFGGTRPLGWLNAGFYAVLLMVAAMSVVFVKRMPSTAIITLYGIVFMNWIGHCWVFLGGARYRYVAEVMFCILAAVTIASIAHRRRPDERQRPATG